MVSTREGSTPKRFIAMSEEAPQSISSCAPSERTYMQVWKRPPLPKASPVPRNCTLTSPMLILLASSEGVAPRLHSSLGQVRRQQSSYPDNSRICLFYISILALALRNLLRYPRQNLSNLPVI